MIFASRGLSGQLIIITMYYTICMYNFRYGYRFITCITISYIVITINYMCKALFTYTVQQELLLCSL